MFGLPFGRLCQNGRILLHPNFTKLVLRLVGNLIKLVVVSETRMEVATRALYDY